VDDVTHRPEVMTLADDEAVVFRGADFRVYDDLSPDSVVDLDGREVRTLPRRGELLARITTVNDVHFGETEAGKIDGVDEWPTYSVPPGSDPYPEFMNAGAVAEMAQLDPDLVVVKGDLTADGTRAEYQRFLDVYQGEFGDRLVHVRGNHESFNELDAAAWPTQERELPGVIVAVLDTSRDLRINGDLSTEQLDWLDELGARADRPVMVFGHHPVWNPAEEPRHDATFGLVPDATDSLAAVFARRPRLVGYFAGHTHRNRVVHLPGAGQVPFVEVASVKEFPGSWAEYRVFDGGILQVHRRISTPDALAWTERTRHMYGGLYQGYALGRLHERCFAMDPAA
jgi:predicted phosphodiesterase